MDLRNSAFIKLAVTGLLVLSAPAYAGVITDSTNSFRVGIDSSGALFDSGVGIERISDGYDPIELGTPRDSWGVSANGVDGSADPTFYGNSGLVANGGPVFIANTAFISSFLTDGFSNLLRIDQSFSFAAPNVLVIGIVVTNVSGSDQSVLFQRNVDWDPPVTFDNVTIIDPLTGFVVDATYDGFQNPNPSAAYLFSSGAGGGSFGPDDLGAGIKIDLGSLVAGSSSSFKYYYGIGASGQTPNALRAQTQGLGASFTTLSHSADGDSNSASQSAVLGVSLDAAAAVPEPGSMAMLAGGCLGLLGFKLRRRSQKA